MRRFPLALHASTTAGSTGPASERGNGVVEGVERCDDGNELEDDESRVAVVGFESVIFEDEDAWVRMYQNRRTPASR